MSGVNAFRHIAIVGTDKGVAEVPRVLLKHIVLHLHSDCAQIFYGKDGRCASVAIGKRIALLSDDLNLILSLLNLNLMLI
jgi:hypothetical protein